MCLSFWVCTLLHLYIDLCALLFFVSLTGLEGKKDEWYFFIFFKIALECKCLVIECLMFGDYISSYDIWENML